MSLAKVRDAWGSQLGDQVEPVFRNPDGVGERQAFKNGLVYYHRGRRVGGFVPFGPVWETWRSYGWERGDLGYPVNATPPTRSGTPWFYADATEFEGGAISQPRLLWNYRPPLRVLWYNTALITIRYTRGDRSRHLKRLIEYLGSDDFDVICLGEVFDNDERRRIQRALRKTHPHTHAGPVEPGLHEDGGLLMLSKYPMTLRTQSVFRAYEGEDGFADKGLIHARIQVSAKPAGNVDAGELGEAAGTFSTYGPLVYGSYSVDIYATHAQAGALLGTAAGSTKARRAQARQIASFVEATSERKVPALVVGDFNMNFHTDSSEWTPLLGHPRDVWSLTHFGEDDPGETVPWTSGVKKRIDAGLLYQAYRSVWVPTSVDVPRVPAGYQPGELSDHYPLDITMRPPTTIAIDLASKRLQVTCRLSSSHAIQTTSGPGDDDVEVWFAHGRAPAERAHLGDFSQGQLKTLGDRAGLRHTTPTNSDIELRLRAEEEDRGFLGSGPERIGRTVTTIPSEHASLMASPFSKRTPHPFALLTGEGSRYAMRVDVSDG